MCIARWIDGTLGAESTPLVSPGLGAALQCSRLAKRTPEGGPKLLGCPGPDPEGHRPGPPRLLRGRFAMRLASLIVALVGAFTLCRAALAEDVLVCWGDSILAGYNNTGDTYTPFGPAPFGDPIPGVHRWDPVTQTWGPVTPYQNFFGTSADPIYGFAAGWRRFHGTELYIIAHAVSGSDATATHPNPAASWHPNVAGGAFPQFVSTHLSPALATLGDPQLRAVLFTTGNNVWTPDLGQDIDRVNGAINTFVPWSSPRFLGIKTYLGTPNDAQSLLQRQSLDAWALPSSRRHRVETLTIPNRTGGLADLFHLTHFGSIYLGFWAAVTEYFQF